MQKAEPQHGQTQQPAARQMHGAAASSQGGRIAQLADMIHNSPLQTAQKKKFDSLFGAAQRVTEEEPLQGKFASESPTQLNQQSNEPQVKQTIPSSSGSGTTAQLKPAVWKLNIGIRKLNGTVQREVADIDYDDETGITVGDVISQLNAKHGELYSIQIVFLGTNAQLNNDLRNPGYTIRQERIQGSGSQMLAVLAEQESLEEKEKAETPKTRPDFIAKQSELISLIETHGFNKIVTGNHINNAAEKSDSVNEGVREQQIEQISGRTLFIDPLFQAPGAEWQYPDQLLAQGAQSSGSSGGKLYILQKDAIYLGVLSKGMYADEVNELVESKGVAVKHYIYETRPVDVIKE